MLLKKINLVLIIYLLYQTTAHSKSNSFSDFNSNSMSKYLFRNRHLKKFLEEYLNPIMVFYINRVKYIRIFYNFAVPKWYQKIN